MTPEDTDVLTDYQVLMLMRAFPKTWEELTYHGFIEALIYFDEFLLHSNRDVSKDEELKKIFAVFIAGWIGHGANLTRKGNRE